MKGIVNVSKVMISCALLLGVGVAYSESTESSHNSTSVIFFSISIMLFFYFRNNYLNHLKRKILSQRF